MSNLSGFDRLLAEFGTHIGIPGLEFDENGMCNFLINERTPLTLRRDMDRHQLIIITCLLEPIPDVITREWCMDILEIALNPMKGDLPGIGREPASGLLMIYHLLPLNLLTIPLMEKAIAALLGLQEKMSSAKTEDDAANAKEQPNAANGGNKPFVFNPA